MNAKRILIVDDDKFASKSVLQLLQVMGHCPEIANDAQQARELVNRQKFDVAFIDKVLGDVSGIEFAAQLRDMGVHIPLVACSGFPSLPEELSAFDAALDKPFTLEQLQEVLDKLLN